MIGRFFHRRNPGKRSVSESTPTQCKENREEMYKFVERMWTLGNTIIGFSIAQILVFLYGLAQYHLADVLKPNRGGIYFIIVFCGAVSFASIFRCHHHEYKMMECVQAPSQAKVASKEVFIGRLVIQVLISLMAIALFQASLGSPASTQFTQPR